MVTENAIEYQMKENIVIRGRMRLETGLHVGGLRDSPQIGGLDMPLILDPITNLPYIPGSSLKGKLRSLIELAKGKIDENGGPHASTTECTDKNCEICVVFGSSKGEETGTTRLIVRDSFIHGNTEDFDTEVKIENVINRIKGSAESPRTIERIPAGTVFDFELVYSIFDKNSDRKYLETVLEALMLLEDSYLGGSGSRGYGKVKFLVTKMLQKTINDYHENKSGTAIIDDTKGVSIADVRRNEKFRKMIKNESA